MNAKRELIAAAVRVLATKTTLIRKPSDFESILSTIFGEETYDYKIARQIEEESARVLEAAKRINTRRKFNKIVKDI